jgi:hypothetical protein
LSIGGPISILAGVIIMIFQNVHDSDYNSDFLQRIVDKTNNSTS